jgi:hypothetical protein
MKKLILSLLLLVTITLSAQYNPDAPWMRNLGAKNGTATLAEMKASFDDFWKTHDPNIPGSGHKPFMRYYTNMQNQLHDDGTVLSSQEIIDIYKQEKQNRGTNRSAANAAVTSNWTPVWGTLPYNSPGQGRVQAVAVDQTNTNIFYVGTPAGGIWKTINGGTTFLPIFDEYPQIGVSGIAIDPANHNIIYIATGDRDHGDTTFVGVYKSTDGGTTWANTGAISGPSKASDIYVNPTNSNMIWVATSSGVFRSLNAGTSWTNVLSGNIRDLKIKPTDPTVVYAVSSSNFYKSTNSGASFATSMTGLPATSGRLVIDVTPANSSVVYALSATTGNAFQGIYKSTDSGATFVATNTTSTTIFGGSTQAWYDMALGVSDTNENEIYTGCLSVFKSTDSGVTLTGTAGTHADIHILRFFNNKLYNGNDGGIYLSADTGTTFSNLTKSIQNQIIYKIAVAKQTSSTIFTGHQDNGCHAFINNNQWNKTQGSDGMDVVIDPTNQNIMYGMIQYGQQFWKNTTAGVSGSAYITGLPTGESNGNWIVPLAINNIGEVFSGFTKLYKMVGTTWTAQSTATVGSGMIDLIEFDPSNRNNVYVANGTGLYKSINGGVTFALSYTAGTSISGICVHSTDSSIVYITTSGTSGQAMKSINGGTTFANIAAGLPSIGKFCIKHQGNNANNPLFVGTNLGVYYKDDTLTTWTAFETGLPNVQVSDLDINLIDNNITASTFGRGVWRSPLPVILGTEQFMLNNIGIYPNPSNGNFSIRLGEIEPKTIDIMDITGKIIVSQKDFQNIGNEITINMTNVANGIYFVKIATEEASVVKKIVKK